LEEEIINSYIILILFTLLGSIGGFFFKKAVDNSQVIIKTIFETYLYIGIILYIGSAFLNILVLKELPYTVVLPLTSITYIWSFLLAYILLDEKIGFKKILGILFIIVGCFLLV